MPSRSFLRYWMNMHANGTLPEQHRKTISSRSSNSMDLIPANTGQRNMVVKSRATRGANPRRWNSLAINRRGYLSHGTAAKLHGLTRRNPETVYLNIEQSPKPAPPGRMTQDTIDLAFSRQQRTSNLIYDAGDASITIIAGKNTKQFGVQDMQSSSGAILRVTSLERTLIDIVVRPAYAGGALQLLPAYSAAQNRTSIENLMVTLKKLDYAYPYHQAIGFLMSKAGYSDRACAALAALPIRHDFYLSHGMLDPRYDKRWRLYYPKDFKA